MTALELLSITQEQKEEGIWFSGIEGEGEFKQWHPNGQLYEHSFRKNNKLQGEYRVWWENGQLEVHCFYKDGKLEGEYKRWWGNAILDIHRLYRDNQVVEDYLKEKL